MNILKFLFSRRRVNTIRFCDATGKNPDCIFSDVSHPELFSFNVPFYIDGAGWTGGPWIVWQEAVSQHGDRVIAVVSAR